MIARGGPEEFRRVAELLGRPPRAAFEVVVRDGEGGPVVILNAPLLNDGTPMPTRYWLVGAALGRAVDRLESMGGIRLAADAVDPDALAAAHCRYAAERDSAIPDDWPGYRPGGGVGGTRQGVKCLHAHLAWHLAGGDDPVGSWVAAQLGLSSEGRGPDDPLAAPRRLAPAGGASDTGATRFPDRRLAELERHE